MNATKRALAMFGLACLLGLAMTPGASAHFLFLRILPASESGRIAEAYFSDRLEAGDPRFIDKIASTKLFLQADPGKFHPLDVHAGDDRLRANLPTQGTLGVIGKLDYGVLKRAKPFLLRHYPRAVAGDAKSLNALEPYAKIPFEIIARFDNDSVLLQVLENGKPVSNPKLELIPSSAGTLKPEKGAVRLALKQLGNVAVVASRTLPEAGKNAAGDEYQEIREFATLSFAWPLDSLQADSEAVAMFEKAIDARAAWQQFPGFTAKLRGHVAGRTCKGTVSISAKGEVEVELDDEVATDWVHEQLESIVLHRFARPRDKKSPVLRFADQNRHHPLGRLLIFEGGRFASSYRVNGDELTVVNRNIGSRNMTITVLENERNKEGKVLPRSYTVQYWDAKTGKLLKSEAFHETWARVGTFDLPAAHLVTEAISPGLVFRNFTLSEHKLHTMK